MEPTSKESNGVESQRSHLQAQSNITTSEGLAALVQVLEQGNKNTTEALKEFHGGILSLHKSMETVVATSSETMTIAADASQQAIEAKVVALNIPSKMNEFTNPDNLKGDVRSAVVHIGVSTVIAIVAWGISLLFREGSSDTIASATTAQPNGAAKPLKIAA